MGVVAGASRAVDDDSVSFLMQVVVKAVGTRVEPVDMCKIVLVFRTSVALLKFDGSEG